MFNEHYTTFLEIGLKALLIQAFHDEIVIKNVMFIKSGYHFGYQLLRQNDNMLSVITDILKNVYCNGNTKQLYSFSRLLFIF